MNSVRHVPIDSTGRSGPTKRIAAGPLWRRTSPGLYVPAHVDPAVVEQRVLEAASRLPGIGAVTGWAALRVHGVTYCDGRGHDVPLVVPPGVRLRGGSGVTVHRERLADDETALVHGIRVTSPLRAAFDAARRAEDLRAAVTILDLALTARVVGRATFDAYLSHKIGWRGLRQVRRAVSLADDRCLSPMESRLRLLWCLDFGLPRPKCNWPVADRHGSFIGRPDLLSEGLAVIGEYDGAEHRSRARHRDDLRRDDAFRRVGLEPFRVVGADLTNKRLVLDRIEAAVSRARESSVPGTWLVKANPGPAS